MSEELKTFTVGIITSSDKGSAGQREDLSGAVIRELCEPYGGTIKSYKILPDEREKLAGTMRFMADSLKVDVIFTTGGTGFSPRDITPEATLDVAERMVPGIPEAMRARSLQITDRAMLTRGVACIRGKTLIINLPGSPKAVRECLEVVLPVLDHALEVLKDQVQDCAR